MELSDEDAQDICDILDGKEKIVTPDDIAHALEAWMIFNDDPHHWATFEAIQYKFNRVVRVTVGRIHSDGTQEQPLTVYNFSLNTDGSVNITTTNLL